ncbi:MAG: alginate lyase family protein [Verrucomicrobiae bacterium]|nr:alginate lyase family protein [Verrucomicrobiae bacterium]
MKFKLILLLSLAVTTFMIRARAQPFVHPGGLHTLADLERMKTNVLAGNSPWIDGWHALERDPQAQSNWQPAARANLGDSRQRADLDAHAAYLNALRWYISGDTNHAECAVRICNAWSKAVNQVPTGNDIPGLSGIPIFNFALAGELLRVYPGWQVRDFSSFTNMLVEYCYPVCHGFLRNHAGRCDSYFWANWDACNLGALIAMGVLCDDTNMFNEGVEYFKNGQGMGSISNAVPFLYATNFAQWQESGRDQEHAQLGVGLLGSACQVAWNQGVDLFGCADNRLLAGAEYVAKCNLAYPASTIPYTFYNNCAEARQPAISINGLGRLDRPVWELIYNHYVVRRGLPAPYSTAMTKLMRPERGSGDHFGYGTLTFTLDATASPFPPNPIPPVPAGLTAQAGVSQVFLNWEKSSNDTAQGYVVRRSTDRGGPFKDIASWKANSAPQYTDTPVSNGVTYYYVVAAGNQAGVSANSRPATAQPAAAGGIPAHWINADVGKGGMAGGATFAGVGENTFIVNSAGGNIGGKSDVCKFTHCVASGGFILTARLVSADWSGREKIGLMARESVAADAKTVALTLGEIGSRQCRLGTRDEAGASMASQAGNDYTWLPVWFKIQRAGDTFTGYQSVDGVNWFKAGSRTVAMTDQCLAGLAVTGGKKDVFTTAVFDHVAVQITSK